MPTSQIAKVLYLLWQIAASALTLASFDNEYQMFRTTKLTITVRVCRRKDLETRWNDHDDGYDANNYNDDNTDDPVSQLWNSSGKIFDCSRQEEPEIDSLPVDNNSNVDADNDQTEHPVSNVRAFYVIASRVSIL